MHFYLKFKIKLNNFKKKFSLSNRDCIIFLIDSSKDMFKANERGEIPFHNAIKCVISTITDKIISSENDLIGICFYGTVNISLFYILKF